MLWVSETTSTMVPKHIDTEQMIADHAIICPVAGIDPVTYCLVLVTQLIDRLHRSISCMYFVTYLYVK